MRVKHLVLWACLGFVGGSHSATERDEILSGMGAKMREHKNFAIKDPGEPNPLSRNILIEALMAWEEYIGFNDQRMDFYMTKEGSLYVDWMMWTMEKQIASAFASAANKRYDYALGDELAWFDDVVERLKETRRILMPTRAKKLWLNGEGPDDKIIAILKMNIVDWERKRGEVPTKTLKWYRENEKKYSRANGELMGFEEIMVECASCHSQVKIISSVQPSNDQVLETAPQTKLGKTWLGFVDPRVKLTMKTEGAVYVDWLMRKMENKLTSAFAAAANQDYQAAIGDRRSWYEDVVESLGVARGLFMPTKANIMWFYGEGPDNKIIDIMNLNIVKWQILAGQQSEVSTEMLKWYKENEMKYSRYNGELMGLEEIREACASCHSGAEIFVW